MMSALLKGTLFLCLLASSPLAAVEKGNLSGFNTGESSFTQVGEPPEVARVRVPMKLTFFEQVVIKSPEGIRRMDYKALKPNTYTFRATINRANHFFISDWHVETVPVRWENETKQWEAELKFYKRYGKDQELEELVGSMPVRGQLVGKDMLFTLEAQGRQKFQNKQGLPLLLVEINSGRYEEKGTVARGNTKGPAAQ